MTGGVGGATGWTGGFVPGFTAKGSGALRESRDVREARSRTSGDGAVGLEREQPFPFASVHRTERRPPVGALPPMDTGLLKRLRKWAELPGAAGFGAEQVRGAEGSHRLGVRWSVQGPDGDGAPLDYPPFGPRLARFRRIRAAADRAMTELRDPDPSGGPRSGDVILRLAGLQDKLIGRIRRDLKQAGLHPSLVDAVPGQELPAVAALLEAWAHHEQGDRPLSSVTGADLHAVRQVVGRGDEAVDRLLQTLPLLPESYKARSGDLAFVEALTEKAFVRGEKLRKEFQFEPSLLEAPLLDRVSASQFGALAEVMSEIHDAVGLDVVSGFQHRHQETSLESIAGWLGLDPEKDPAPSDPASAMESFVAGARKLGEVTATPFRTDEWPLAVALSGADRHLAESLESLLERAAPDGHPQSPWVLLDLARSLSRCEPQRRQEALDTLDRVSEAMGQVLTPPEAAALVRAWSIGKQVDAYDPEQLAALTTPPEDFLALKDVHTWTRLRRVERRLSREELESSIEKRLRPGTTRIDDNAEYSDRFEDHRNMLSTPELHKIRKLQDALHRSEFKQELRELVALATYRSETEWGGTISLEMKGPKLNMLPPKSFHDSERYDLPFEDGGPVDAMAHFHMHVPDERGDPRISGPSSGFDGAVADRGAAYVWGQDGVVFSLVAPERVNASFFTADGAVVNLGDFDVPIPGPYGKLPR